MVVREHLVRSESYPDRMSVRYWGPLIFWSQKVTCMESHYLLVYLVLLGKIRGSYVINVAESLISKTLISLDRREKESVS